MTALAVILARAGSKGVPGKNAMPIAGKPCAQWTIEHARAAHSVGPILLSTDDPALIDLAHAHNIHAIRRPPHLATDSATVDDAARHAVAAFFSELPTSEFQLPTSIVLLYANCPVRPPDLIDRAVRRMSDTACDSVQSYAPVGKMHPWWMARVDADTSAVRPWQGDILNHNTYRRQDLPPALIPDGGVLVVSRRALFLEIPGVPPGPHAFLGLDRRGVLNHEGDVIDIDSPIDAIVADTILSQRCRGRAALGSATHTPSTT